MELRSRAPGGGRVAVVSAELTIEAAKMPADGLGADEEAFCDFVIFQALTEKTQDLAFPGSEVVFGLAYQLE
jgi:hypothetical protein